MGECQCRGLGALVQHPAGIQPVTQLVPKGKGVSRVLDEYAVARMQVNYGAGTQRFLQLAEDLVLAG